MTAVFATQIEVDSQAVAWLAGTRTKVIEVVLDKVANGWSAEEIHFQHPHLSLAQIHAALTWYYENQTQMDAEVRNRLKGAESLRTSVADPHFLRRLADLKSSF